MGGGRRERRRDEERVGGEEGHKRMARACECVSYSREK
jgi:hypothetical protein